MSNTKQTALLLAFDRLIAYNYLISAVNNQLPKYLSYVKTNHVKYFYMEKYSQYNYIYIREIISSFSYGKKLSFSFNLLNTTLRGELTRSVAQGVT